MKNPSVAGLDRKRKLQIVGIMAGIFLLLGLLFAVMIYAMQTKSEGLKRDANAPSAYIYEEVEASNGMRLHVLETRPSNITLASIRNNISLTPYYGVNGGFFYENSLLSIAVVDGLPVNGAPDDYGSGAENVKYARGTLVWDGASDKLSVQVVRQAADLKVMDHTRFWAQGGISMSLGQDQNWLEQIEAEQAPYPDDARLRSAAVYNREGLLFLVVSSSKGSLQAFRDAIIEKVGRGMLVDGIFLDGDGSSQLRSAEKTLTGDNRPVVQMMRLVK
ncbi:hypothetical protein PghCCS26_53710 [Paenibacillus glycanilyticus]|uniref:Phosphodiester glycosidase domain-containing protein n=1 Tax=Paenibacillus glycanilyticus TaxID=126569 RepID=A0ABQ6NT19_9BACL|nr:hypothetical protein [Paenibacillus glycanilyticus]GMK48241.1 hypothetical protein PghCCS26_53710 [Paenibacillus glycanilyticus]